MFVFICLHNSSSLAMRSSCSSSLSQIVESSNSLHETTIDKHVNTTLNNFFIEIHIVSPESSKLVIMYKESVELTFVYLIEGCGKTSLEINDTIPHTRIDMGYGYAERDLPQVSIRSECCSVPSFQLENFHIFDKGLAKNTFTICNVKRFNRLTLQK